MRLSRLALLLTGCALTALASPTGAQEPPSVPPQSGNPLPPPADPAIVIENAAVAPPPPVVVAIPAEWSPVPADEMGRTAYGLYLSGRLAAARGDNAVGAELLARSQALTPEQPVVGEEAFRSGLFAGDLETLAELAPSVQGTPLLAEAGRLVVIVDALNGGDAAASLALLRSRPFTEPFETIGRYILPAVAASAGDWNLALAPVPAAPEGVDSLVLRHQRVRLLESRRRHAEAEAEYRLLTATPLGAQLFAADFGRFLERRGRRDEALALYEASLTGPSPDPEALAGRIRVLGRAAPPPVPTIRENAAFAIKLVAIQTAERGQRDVSAIFLRLADSLGPDDEVALRLGLSLVALGHEETGREAFGRVTQANPIIYAGAQFGLGLSFQRDEREEEALAAYRRADVSAPGQMEVIFKLAQLLIAMDRPEEALAVLNRPSVNVAGQAPGIRFLRGAVLETLGRLDEAENELWAALTAAPNEPAILNHLGYMWVDTGRRVEQGAEMLARAHAADPQNGNIQDSLGWAQFRQGQYDTAVETLEGAVSKEPANAEINDHLGDAYWQVGRRREAQWQWNRVLTLDPDAARRAEVEQKLANGLSVAPPVSAGQS
jgi:Flp pilus assembly protein TadD